MKRSIKIALFSLAGFATLIILCVVALFLLVRAGHFGEIPGKGELSEIEHHTASEVYSADGQLLGTYFVENRSTIERDKLPPELIHAVLAIEDIRFFDHDGIDRWSLLRVMLKSVILQQDAGGGSTITQQLAKKLYPRENYGSMGIVLDKLREMIIARRIEQTYDKNTILLLYLNTVSFGDETFGVESASRRFFNKSASELRLKEAALLAAVLRGPAAYHPVHNSRRGPSTPQCGTQANGAI